jgi:hypothetical protein
MFLLLMHLAVPALAGERSKWVRFPAGKTSQTVKGSVAGADYVDDIVRVRAGRSLSVAYEILYAPFFGR